MNTAAVAGGAAGAALLGLIGFAFGRPAHPAVGGLVGALVGGVAGAVLGNLESQPPSTAKVTLSPGALATTVSGSGGTATFVLPSGSKWQSFKDAAGTDYATSVVGTSSNLPVNLQNAMVLGSTSIFTAAWVDSAGAAQQSLVTVTLQS